MSNIRFKKYGLLNWWVNVKRISSGGYDGKKNFLFQTGQKKESVSGLPFSLFGFKLFCSFAMAFACRTLSHSFG
jgi:hypothetical protein